MSYDPSDPDDVAEAEAQQANAHAERQAAWRRLVEQPCGRIVLAHILAMSGYGKSSYVPGSFDQTAFNEGKKALGVDLYDVLSVLTPQFLPDIEARLRECSGVGIGNSNSDE